MIRSMLCVVVFMNLLTQFICAVTAKTPEDKHTAQLWCILCAVVLIDDRSDKKKDAHP